MRAAMPSTPCCRSHRPLPSRPAALFGRGLALWLSLCGGAALAQVSTQPLPDQTLALQASRNDVPAAPSSLYEVTATRSRVLARAVELSQAGGRVSNELAAVTYSVWRTHGRAEVGAGVGTLGYLVPPSDRLAGTPTALVGAVPTVSMGLRFRVTDEHALFADAYRARGPAAGAAVPGYGGKLGVEWRPAKQTLGLEHGAVGMQLESGYRLSLKLRHGGPSVYLRGKF